MALIGMSRVPKSCLLRDQYPFGIGRWRFIWWVIARVIYKVDFRVIVGLIGDNLTLFCHQLCRPQRIDCRRWLYPPETRAFLYRLQSCRCAQSGHVLFSLLVMLPISIKNYYTTVKQAIVFCRRLAQPFSQYFFIVFAPVCRWSLHTAVCARKSIG